MIDAEEETMRQRNLMISMALGALAASCYAGFRRSQSRVEPSADSQADPQRQPLQTWEGEGGGVPVEGGGTVSQVRPNPAALSAFDPPAPARAADPVTASLERK